MTEAVRAQIDRRLVEDVLSPAVNVPAARILSIAETAISSRHVESDVYIEVLLASVVFLAAAERVVTSQTTMHPIDDLVEAFTA